MSVHQSVCPQGGGQVQPAGGGSSQRGGGGGVRSSRQGGGGSGPAGGGGQVQPGGGGVRSSWGRGGQPRYDNRRSYCYAAGGMPLAFTQEDFLIFVLILSGYYYSRL